MGDMPESKSEGMMQPVATRDHQDRYLAHVSKLAKIGVWEFDFATTGVEWSDGIYDMLDVDFDFVPTLGRMLEFYSEVARKKLKRLFDKALAGEGTSEIEVALRTARGKARWVRLRSYVEFCGDAPVRRIVVQQDITEQKETDSLSHYLAACDVLTGFANRQIFLERLAVEANAIVSGTSSHLAVLLIDIDDFKTINDTHGHQAGDDCLKTVAQRIQKISSNAALISRLGGDEFGIIVTGALAGDIINSMANPILKALRVPIRWRKQSFQISGSIGVARRSCGGQVEDPYDLQREADLALYAAKAAGRNAHREYDVSMLCAAQLRFDSLRLIQNAIKERRLELLYQPKVRLSDHRICGVEALIRCRGEDGRLLTPGDFRPALDDFEMSYRVGEVVMGSALRQAARWRAEGFNFGHIAINLSASQFRDGTFANDLLHHMAKLDLPPSVIEVEITEGVLLSRQSDKVGPALARLREKGVRIAFDDFGTGFASLTHLREFAVDCLKIDRSFIRNIDQMPENKAIVQAMAMLGQNLGMDIVVEGIETEAELDIVKSFHCQFAQGYYFARPLPAADVQRLMKKAASGQAGRLQA